MPYAASKSTRRRTRAERLEAHVTAEQKSLIERAAAMQGRSMTDFVYRYQRETRRGARSRSTPRCTSVRDSEAFIDALRTRSPSMTVCATRCAAIESEPAFDAWPAKAGEQLPYRATKSGARPIAV